MKKKWHLLSPKVNITTARYPIKMGGLDKINSHQK